MVLDPVTGRPDGTTALITRALRRRFIGRELPPPAITTTRHDTSPGPDVDSRLDPAAPLGLCSTRSAGGAHDR
jgi:hypothetical protein